MFKMVSEPSTLSQASDRGFSLIEVLVVIAILGVLAGLAAPSFSRLFERYRVDATREELLATLQLARAESIRQGRRIVVERQTGTECVALTSNRDWSCGWIVFADLNGDNTRNAATEPILHQHEVHPGVSVVKSNNAPLDQARSDRFGQLDIAINFLIQPRNGAAANGAILCIGAGSRIRTIKGATACT